MNKDKIISFLPYIIIAVFLAWYFYYQGKQDARIENQLQQIVSIRKALDDSVKVIKLKTTERDEKLRAVIYRDMEIMDTLNVVLQKLNKNSQAIEIKIENHKKTLDDLWNVKYK